MTEACPGCFGIEEDDHTLMTDEIYNLFRKTFPDIIRGEYAVRKILSRQANRIISHRENGALAGVSVIGGNVIYLICVDEAYQKRGIGSTLLKQSEDYVKTNGFNSVIIGAGDDYITPGVPMQRGAHLFFQKRGYVNAWGEHGSFDMSQDLTEFSQNEHTIGDTVNGVHYRLAAESDLDDIVECATQAEAHFGDYDPKNSFAKCYKENTDPVLVAVKDGEITGTLIIGLNAEGPGIGSLGCTAVKPEHMGKGIATQMVILGTKHLKDLGFKKGFLSYTYADIVKLYARAGYSVCMEYYMAEKKLLTGGSHPNHS